MTEGKRPREETPEPKQAEVADGQAADVEMSEVAKGKRRKIETPEVNEGDHKPIEKVCHAFDIQNIY